jgi:hypothetical protein
MSPRGNKSSAALIEKRRGRLLELKQQGKTTIEAEEILTSEGFPADRVTLWRDLSKLREGFSIANRQEFSTYVQEQIALLTQVIEELWEGSLPPETANSIRGLMDSIARLTGSNAPTKSIHATVPVEHSQELLEYREAFAGLYEDERYEELARVKARKRTCRVTITADGWGRAKQLEESCGS